MAEDATQPVHPPVVLALVTSGKGVLLSRRREGPIKWGFISGKINPGESPAEAAVREVAEETGLAVRAAEREISRRVHPVNGHTMIYLACEPVAGIDVEVLDTEELAEVRWATLAEALTLLGDGLFEPARRHLVQTLGPAA